MSRMKKERGQSRLSCGKLTLTPTGATTGVLAAALLSAGLLTPAFAAERGPEYDALAIYLGAWTQKGREAVFREECDWYDGRFQIVCHSTSSRADGSTGRGISILGYTSTEGYVYTGIGNRGRFEMLRGGTYANGQFVFKSTAQEDGKSVTSRITIGPRSAEGFPFVVDTSTDGGPWTRVDTTEYIALPQDK